MIASLLFPYDDDAPSLIEGWMDELEREGCIRRYVVDGAHYVDIPKWLEHQKIDRPSKSKIPTFVEGSRIIARSREPSSEDLDQGPGPRTKDQGPGIIVADERANENFHFAGKRVLEAMGVGDDPRWFGNYAIVSAWLAAGYDLEADILPTVRRLMGIRNGQGPPKSLKYFTQAIADAHAERTGTVIVKPTVRNGNGQRNQGENGADHVAARRADIMAGIARGVVPGDGPAGVGDG